MSKGYVTTEGFYDSPVMLGATRIQLERSDVMPIHGLSEINRPPRQGMLRLGIKKKTTSGKEYPAEVDYFILDPETPDAEEKQRLIDEFHRAFGDKPKTIAISLPSSDIDEVFPQNFKRYGRNTSLKCIGDGLEAVCTDEKFAQGLKTIGHDERGFPKVVCKGRDCVFAVTNEKASTKECKATATLSAKIPVLGGIGVWQVTTGSFNSIVNINSCIRNLVQDFGRAHALPLILERRPQETTYQGKKTTHYTLHINTDKSIQELVRQAQIAPDRVLIEAYGEQVDSLPAPAEIMDSELVAEEIPDKTVLTSGTQRVTDDTVPIHNYEEGECAPEKPLMINCPPVVEPPMDTPAVEIPEVPFQPPAAKAAPPEKAMGAVQENTKPEIQKELEKGVVASVDKDVEAATQKVVDAFDGQVVDEMEAEKKQSQTFLDGCADEAKEELGADTKRNKPPVNYPQGFAPFMVFCKNKLEEAGFADSYKETFRLYNVASAADLEKDLKKQKDIKIYLDALLQEKELV